MFRQNPTPRMHAVSVHAVLLEQDERSRACLWIHRICYSVMAVNSYNVQNSTATAAMFSSGQLT